MRLHHIRKIKSIDIDEFKGDITRSGLIDREGSLDELVGAYNSVLSDLLNKHAPLKKRVITVHPDTKWMNNEIKEAKSQ